MTEAITISEKEMDDLRAEDLRGWPDDRLLTVIDGCFQHAAQALYNGAVAWVEARRRGLSVPKVANKLAKFLPWVAANELAAEVVQKYPYPYLLEAVRGVPLGRQRELADGAMIRVATDAEAGTMETTLGSLSLGLSKFVFRHGRECDLQEQRDRIKARDLKTPARRSKEQPKVVIKAVAAGQRPYRPLPKENRDAAKTVTEMVELIPVEHEALLCHARAAGIGVRELIRMTLHAQGLLTKGAE